MLRLLRGLQGIWHCPASLSLKWTSLSLKWTAMNMMDGPHSDKELAGWSQSRVAFNG